MRAAAAQRPSGRRLQDRGAAPPRPSPQEAVAAKPLHTAQRAAAACVEELREALSRIIASPNQLQLYTAVTGLPAPLVALDKWARMQLLTANSQPLKHLTAAVVGLLDVLYLADCPSMTLTVGSVADGILRAISKELPPGDLTVAQLDAHLCFWFVDELKPHLARLMRSNIVPMHVLALLTAQAAVRVYAGGEGTVSMADLDKRLYCALAECRGLMVEAALQAVRLYVAWRVKLKAEEFAERALEGLPYSLVEPYLRHLGWEADRQLTALLDSNLATPSQLPEVAASLAQKPFSGALNMMALEETKSVLVALEQPLVRAKAEFHAWLPELKAEIVSVARPLTEAAAAVERALAARAQQGGPGSALSDGLVGAVGKLRDLMFLHVAERPKGGVGLKLQPQEMARQLAWGSTRFAVNIELRLDLPKVLPMGLDTAAEGLLGGKMGVWVGALVRASSLLAPPGCDPRRAQLFGDVLQVCGMAGVLAPVDVRKTVAREIRRLQQQQQQQQQQQREQQEQQQLGASSGKASPRRMRAEVLGVEHETADLMDTAALHLVAADPSRRPAGKENGGGNSAAGSSTPGALPRAAGAAEAKAAACGTPGRANATPRAKRVAAVRRVAATPPAALASAGQARVTGAEGAGGGRAAVVGPGATPTSAAAP